jgi:hypothetical protein
LPVRAEQRAAHERISSSADVVRTRAEVDTVYADYITEGDGGKAAPLRRPVASSAGNVVSMRRSG